MTAAPLTALPPFAEALHKLLEESKGRLAEVTATKDYAVQVKVAGESAGGNTWYATPVMSVPVAATGILIPMRGGNWYFQPLGIPRSVHEVEGITPNILMNNVQRLKFGTGLNVSNWEGWLADVHVDTDEIASRAYLAANHPRVLAGGAFIEQTYSTAGDRVFTGAQTEFTGLAVGGTYNVEYTATFIAQGTSGVGSFGAQSTSNGSSVLPFTFGYGVPVTTKREHIAGYSTTRTVGGDGKITVAPVFRWNSGSVYIEAVYLTATVTAI